MTLTMNSASTFLSAVQNQYETRVVQSMGIKGNFTLAIICAVAAVIIFLHFFCSGWFFPTNRKYPPSPPGRPILGHLHLLGPAPHVDMAQISQKYGPLVFLKLGTKANIVISSPAIAREIFKQHDLTFSNRPHFPVMEQLDHMKQGFTFIPNNGTWQKLRRIFTTELKTKSSKPRQQQIRAEETSNVLKSMLADKDAPIELYSKIHQMSLDLLSRVVLSRRFSAVQRKDNTVEVEEFTAVSHELSRTLGTFNIGDYIPCLSWLDIGGRKKQAIALNSRLQGILTLILNEHRAKRKRNNEPHVDADMVDALLSHHEAPGEESITEDNVRAVTWDAFMGGTETSSSLSEWMMARILQSPHILAKLTTEIDQVVGRQRRVSETDIPNLKYLQVVTKETLRLHPPIPLMVTHESREHCTIAGYYIPAFTRLHVNLWAMGRDPSVWERPLDFFPERFLDLPLAHADPVSGQTFELMPFGSGRRICPAAQFGLLTTQLVVASIVQAFHVEPATEPIAMAEGTGIVLRMATPLKLRCVRLAFHFSGSTNPNLIIFNL